MQVYYFKVHIYVAAKSLQSCPTLCDPIDGSPLGSSIPGILQARILEWVAISFSNAWKWKVKVKSLKSCPTLSDPMDCSLPGSSIHGIFQARVLEWGAIAFSGRSYLAAREGWLKTQLWVCLTSAMLLCFRAFARYPTLPKLTRELNCFHPSTPGTSTSNWEKSHLTDSSLF